MEIKSPQRRLSPAAAELEANPRLKAELMLARRNQGIQTNGITSMEDFWIAQGWYKEDMRTGEIRLTRAKWESDIDVQIYAIKTLVGILGKDPRDITREDFRSNRLRGVLAHYGESPFAAISEAFPELGIKEWEMTTTPQGFYNSKENRIAAVKWLVEKLQKDPKDITQEDFISNGLRGFLEHYGGSPFKIISEAFPELGIKEWEMATPPQGFYQTSENRTAATKWLVEKLHKDPRDITQKDFTSNRLSRLITSYYNSSPYIALYEAGLVSREDEAYMRSRNHKS